MILGLTLDTVKIRLHRAREKLRKDLLAGCDLSIRDERAEFALREPVVPRLLRHAVN